MTRALLSSLAATMIATCAMAAPELGTPAANFKDLDAADGKKYSLSDFKQDVLVIAVTCNHCPVAQSYQDRFIEFAKKHTKDGKVAFIALNVNTMEEDALPEMKNRAKEAGFNFPYLYDPSQESAKAIGASKTPELFVFDKDRKLVYTGQFDDSWSDPTAVKSHFVEEAVDALLSGKEPPKSTKAQGCGIRFNR